MKKIQSRFFRGNVLAQTGHFLTKEEVDKMRQKVIGNLLKPDKRYRNGYKDPKHLARVGKLPCSLCFFLGAKQTSRTTVHHYHGGGMGKKASDLKTMSLCENHHQKGEFAFHHIGRLAFEEKFGIDQEGLIEITNRMLCSE